jgi:hypothetical protein
MEDGTRRGGSFVQWITNIVYHFGDRVQVGELKNAVALWSLLYYCGLVMLQVGD